MHAKDIELRESQAAFLRSGRRISTVNLPDGQVRDSFTKLYKSISKWVLTHFESLPLAEHVLTSEITSVLERAQPDYRKLIQSPETVNIVLRGLVADILAQAFTSGQLLGNEVYWELKQVIGLKGGTCHHPYHAPQANGDVLLTASSLRLRLERMESHDTETAREDPRLSYG